MYRLKSGAKKFNSSVSFSIMPILKNFHEMFGLTGLLGKGFHEPWLTETRGLIKVACQLDRQGVPP
jgi:hypothetical protein